jgi:hypothetical protein
MDIMDIMDSKDIMDISDSPDWCPTITTWGSSDNCSKYLITGKNQIMINFSIFGGL